MEFYKYKTFDRIEKLSSIGKEVDTVNGIHTGLITEMLGRVDWHFLGTDTFYQFHGDFIMDNIIKTSSGYKLIDWRQDFGGELHLGDMYYDLAKFRHNIIFNHHNVDSGLFRLDFGENGVIVDLKCNYFLMKQIDDFDRFVTDNNLNLKKIRILMAIIWLNMAPLHEKNISKFLFYFGKYNLQLELSSSVVIL
jgi:thiamine kinase-like enzyme